MSESQCDNIVRDMGRILLMVAQGTDRVFGSGCSMRYSAAASLARLIPERGRALLARV
jgi:hypothetical protein